MAKSKQNIQNQINEIEYKKQAKAAYIDAIISFFILGLFFAIIALVRANKALMSEDEETLTEANKAKKLAIISLIIDGVLALFGAIARSSGM